MKECLSPGIPGVHCRTQEGCQVGMAVGMQLLKEASPQNSVPERFSLVQTMMQWVSERNGCLARQELLDMLQEESERIRGKAGWFDRLEIKLQSLLAPYQAPR